MKKSMKIKIYLLIICAVANSYISANSVSITYNFPGNFVYGSGYTAAPTSPNDSMLVITSSNIVIDFGGGIFTQSGTVDGFAGITIAPNISNVTLKNGIISGLTGSAVVVNDGCSNIFLNSMTIINCADAGIYFAGTQTGIIDLSIKNCSFSNMVQK